MPFIQHTPESLIRRADSKNPATTCKGITTSGIHCRRSLAPARNFLHLGHRTRDSQDGVLALLQPAGDQEDEGAAVFFCWQHKDQATNLINTVDGLRRQGSIVHLNKRTSIDTLAERLGIIDLDSHSREPKRREKYGGTSKHSRKETLPQRWQKLDGPVLSVSTKAKKYDSEKLESKQRSTKRNKPSGLARLCCIVESDSEQMPPMQTRKRYQDQDSRKRKSSDVPTRVQPTTMAPICQQRRPSENFHNAPGFVPHPHATSQPQFNDQRPHQTRQPFSQTETLLSLIPKSLSPETTSAILAELAKPISTYDEPGYIYIFWLTPGSTDESDVHATQSLLESPIRPYDATVNSRSRRKTTSGTPHNTLLLKIGRASNVQRRMNEWTRQCGYNLSLLRFYPHMPSQQQQNHQQQSAPSPLPSPRREHNASNGRRSSSSHYLSSNHQPSSDTSSPASNPSSTPKKVPHAHKVERLIHLELADKRVKRACEECGKEHREWFEVLGTRKGVAEVDSIVKRWVNWAEKEAMK